MIVSPRFDSFLRYEFIRKSIVDAGDNVHVRVGRHRGESCGRRKNSHVTRKIPAEEVDESVFPVVVATNCNRPTESDLCFIFRVASADASLRYLRTPSLSSSSRTALATPYFSPVPLARSSVAKRKPMLRGSRRSLSLSRPGIPGRFIRALKRAVPGITKGQLNQTLL